MAVLRIINKGNVTCKKYKLSSRTGGVLNYIDGNGETKSVGVSPGETKYLDLTIDKVLRSREVTYNIVGECGNSLLEESN